jgi:hypothetical protein
MAKVDCPKACIDLAETLLQIAPVPMSKCCCSARDVAVVPLDEPWAARQYKIGVRKLAELPVAASLLIKHLCGCVKPQTAI